MSARSTATAMAIASTLLAPMVRTARAGGAAAARVGILEALRSTDPARRRDAVADLELQPRAWSTEPLGRALADADAEVRMRAAGVLGRQHVRSATAALLGRLGDPDPRVRAEAAEALGELDAETARAELERALVDGDHRVRRAAAVALGRLGPEGSLGALVARLEDESAAVRRVAVELLGEAGDDGALLPLVARLADASADVRGAAVAALESLDDPRAAAGVARLLSDGSDDVRAAAMRALGRLGGPSHRALLVAAVERATELRRDAALAGLARLAAAGDRTSAAFVVEALERPALARAAREALLSAEAAPPPRAAQGADSRSAIVDAPATEQRAALARGSHTAGGGSAIVEGPAAGRRASAAGAGRPAADRSALVDAPATGASATADRAGRSAADGAAIVEALADALASSGGDQPGRAAVLVELLGASGDGRALAPLTGELVLGRVPRRQVISALAALGDRRGVPALGELIDDDDVAVRRAVLGTLAAWLDASPPDVALSRLVLHARSDPDAACREAAVACLGALATPAAPAAPAAIDALIEIVSRGETLPLRVAAVRALAAAAGHARRPATRDATAPRTLASTAGRAPPSAMGGATPMSPRGAALAALVDAAGGDVRDLRVAAVGALARLNDPTTVAPLSEALERALPPARADVALALGLVLGGLSSTERAGPTAARALAALVAAARRDGTAAARSTTMSVALAATSDPSAVALVVDRALHASESSQRRAAVAAIGVAAARRLDLAGGDAGTSQESGAGPSARVAPPPATARPPGRPPARAERPIAGGGGDDTGAMDDVLRSAIADALGDRDPQVRGEAAWAAAAALLPSGAAGSSRATEVARDVLKALERLARAPEPDVRVNAVAALGHLGRALPADALFDDDDDVRANAALAGGPQAISRLRRLLRDDPATTVRAAARSALLRLGDVGSVRGAEARDPAAAAAARPSSGARDAPATFAAGATTPSLEVRLRVVDPRGAPLVERPVRLRTTDGWVEATVTDADGVVWTRSRDSADTIVESAPR